MVGIVRSLILVCSIFPMVFGQSAVTLHPKPSPQLEPANNTKGWSFPYTSPSDKSKRVREGIPLILKEKVGTPISKFVQALGTPDVIEDFSTSAHMGLSINEDSMMMKHGNYIRYRVIWFLTKKCASSPNLKDSWFAAYVTTDGATVYKVMKNNLE